MRISDWSSDVCSSDLRDRPAVAGARRDPDPGERRRGIVPTARAAEGAFGCGAGSGGAVEERGGCRSGGQQEAGGEGGGAGGAGACGPGRGRDVEGGRGRGGLWYGVW